jgi:hypothetical protein
MFKQQFLGVNFGAQTACENRCLILLSYKTFIA